MDGKATWLGTSQRITRQPEQNHLTCKRELSGDQTLTILTLFLKINHQKNLSFEFDRDFGFAKSPTRIQNLLKT
jgi:hypothetical protein